MFLIVVLMHFELLAPGHKEAFLEKKRPLHLVENVPTWGGTGKQGLRAPEKKRKTASLSWVYTYNVVHI